MLNHHVRRSSVFYMLKKFYYLLHVIGGGMLFTQDDIDNSCATAVLDEPEPFKTVVQVCVF